MAATSGADSVAGLIVLVSKHEKTLDDHEARLRSLERRRYVLEGIKIAIAAVAAGLSAWIGAVAH